MARVSIARRRHAPFAFSLEKKARVATDHQKHLTLPWLRVDSRNHALCSKALHRGAKFMLMKVHPDTVVPDETDTPDDVCSTDPALLKAWVAALRSGAYSQGSGALVSTIFDGVTRHCCLGVLMELGGFARAQFNYSGKFVHDGSGEHLEPRCGLSAALQFHLSCANDGGRKDALARGLTGELPPIERGEGPRADFNRIADWIEGYLLS